MQKVLGPSDTDCPLYQRPMSEVCHKCAWWAQVVRAMNVNTGEAADEWNCAVPQLLLLQFEAINQLRHVDGTMQAFRTETTQTNITALALGLGVKPSELQRGEVPKQLDQRQIFALPPSNGKGDSGENGEEQGTLF
jgi:hypothetical protein